MDYSKVNLIRLAIERGILRFGDFTLKSGRLSPYFFNTGLFYHGDSLRILGQHYAKAIIQNKIEVQHLFGPAYKGIPLVTATAVALAEHKIDCTITFNRKETKDHGEGGILIGAPLTGDTILIDDVISAGTAFREAQQLITSHGGKLTTVIITLDRCERGLNDRSAIADIKAQGIQVFSLFTVYDLIDYLKTEQELESVNKIEKYLKEYGNPAS
jgi:orotate phosphoribosyltransferase